MNINAYKCPQFIFILYNTYILGGVYRRYGHQNSQFSIIYGYNIRDVYLLPNNKFESLSFQFQHFE